MENLPWRVNIRGESECVCGCSSCMKGDNYTAVLCRTIYGPNHPIAPGLQGRLHCGLVNLLWGGREQWLN